MSEFCLFDQYTYCLRFNPVTSFIALSVLYCFPIALSVLYCFLVALSVFCCFLLCQPQWQELENTRASTWEHSCSLRTETWRCSQLTPTASQPLMTLGRQPAETLPRWPRLEGFPAERPKYPPPPSAIFRYLSTGQCQVICLSLSLSVCSLSWTMSGEMCVFGVWTMLGGDICLSVCV